MAGAREARHNYCPGACTTHAQFLARVRFFFLAGNESVSTRRGGRSEKKNYDPLQSAANCIFKELCFYLFALGGSMDANRYGSGDTIFLFACHIVLSSYWFPIPSFCVWETTAAGVRREFEQKPSTVVVIV